MEVLPKKGDIIRFPRKGGYSHFAIYIGDGQVIHRSSPPDSFNAELSGASARSQAKSVMAVIRKDDLKTVAGDCTTAQIANSLDSTMKPFAADEIVKRAKQRLGEKGYDLFFKNCEHFVMWCRYGIEKSEQVEEFVEKLKKYGAQFLINQIAEVAKARHEISGTFQ